METTYIQDKKFEKIDFTTNEFTKGDYENCSFINCNFSYMELSKINFTECLFISCNLSLAKLAQTSFRDIQFKDSKLVGLHFDNCDEFLFAVDFDDCILDLSSFYKRKLKKTKFKNASLQEVDFTEADLTNSLFDNCNLEKAIFANTILEKADLRTSYNYSIHPESNKIKKARFSMTGIAGLLDKYDIEIE